MLLRRLSTLVNLKRMQQMGSNGVAIGKRSLRAEMRHREFSISFSATLAGRKSSPFFLLRKSKAVSKSCTSKSLLSELLHQPRHPLCGLVDKPPSNSGRFCAQGGSIDRGRAKLSSCSPNSNRNAPSAAPQQSTSGGQQRTPEGSPGASTDLGLLPSNVGVLVTSWKTRAASFARESVLLLYSGLIDNTLVVVLEQLKVDALMRALQPRLEGFSAKWFGSYHKLKDGRRIPLSLVNNTAPGFEVPSQYHPSKLPFGALGSRSGYDSQIAHFMALCMKAAYEEPEVIQDMAERQWGMQFHGYFQTQTVADTLYDVENQRTTDFIPRTRACMLSFPGAVVIAFRGSEPLNLINLRSSGNSRSVLCGHSFASYDGRRITMRRRLDMGRIHDGFYAALFHSDPEQANSLYTQLMEKLRSLDSETKRPILLSGHSLGGALAVIFAAALLKNHADVAARVSSVYTFGMPRVGDAEFCDNMSRAFPGACHRISHAADIIPLVPPQFLEYSHFGDEHYLTSLGQEVCGDEGIRRARRAETLGFLPLYLLKLVAGLLDYREGGLRAIYRLVMLVTFPGLNDHFPADYVQKLERQLK